MDGEYLKSKSLRYFNTKSNNIRSGDIISDAKKMMGPHIFGEEILQKEMIVQGSLKQFSKQITFRFQGMQGSKH